MGKLKKDTIIMMGPPVVTLIGMEVYQRTTRGRRLTRDEYFGGLVMSGFIGVMALMFHDLA